MILAIDATNWIHVLWHTQPGPDLAQTVATRVKVLAESLRATHIVAAFDRRSFRRDLCPAYKAHREAKPADLVAALAAAEEAVAAVATIAAEVGFEADDQLATLARLGVAAGERVVLASPDKDVRQCLMDGWVSILRKFSVSQGAITKPEWLTARQLGRETGLVPAQWPDYQALCGDPTDGIQGCPGIGPKTAAAILVKCQTLRGCWANPFAMPVTPAKREAVLKFRGVADLVLQLVTLRTDCQAAADALR